MDHAGNEAKSAPASSTNLSLMSVMRPDGSPGLIGEGQR